MRFTVNRDVFSEAVSFAVKLLPQRPTQPLLSGALIEAEGELLTVSSFDYEVSARTSVLAEVTEAGRALVSGRLLSEIAQRLPHSDVEVSLLESRVEVRCGSASFSLPAMPVEEYPQVPRVEDVTGAVPADVFSDAIAQVSLAASKDDVTPVITGVQFEISENSLTLTATDRYRVATRGIDWENAGSQGDLTALVPSKIVTEVGKTFSGDGQVKVAIIKDGERELVAFTGGSKTVTSLLIKGNYPPVGRLFPESVDNYAVVNTAELVEAVGRVGLVLEREAALRFSFAEGTVTLEAAGTESAQAVETVDAHLVGDEMVVSLKPQFLLDGLRSTHSEFARIAFTRTDNPGKPGPVLITSQRSKDEVDEESFKYLLQPNLLLR
ncbi:DNA polymerase III subunit beta [Leucobacter luti]|uniref:Beta sliding clamp n=1 Tax=Leucobacter luti TaxID=340320 RepID=A0A4R6S155_9MICO|nr:DNA polymerase III subunit beta [Leucobacter luti]MCW2289340.1 DNA polymerase-3 subunit beta [Leucobacter luti]QYM74867.1 DNA polymerase III subunit beta [Leucobacter luti]TCK39900.1 DNA polymerase III beta subunit [Leucobacter luti]TDP93241.1 DNA polymerase III beta subunit [Leucobacter luti]